MLAKMVIKYDSNLGDQSDFPWVFTEVIMFITSVFHFLLKPAVKRFRELRIIKKSI